MKRFTILLLLAASCGPRFDPDAGEQDLWASREQIVEAAARCGIPKFEPYPANAHYAAYVSEDVPDHAAKEDCIYDDLRKRQGLQVTR